MKVLLLALVLVYVNVDARSLSAKSKSVLDEIPEQDQQTFIKKQLLIGYLLQNQDIAITVSNDVTLDIYNYYLTNNLITDKERLQALGDTICFPNGDCIDPDDPGVYPFSKKE